MSKQQPNVAWLRDRFLNFESKLGHNKNSCIRKGEELKRLIYTLKQATLALWIFPQRCVGKQICGTSPNHPPKMLIGQAITGWCQNRWSPELPLHIKIYLPPNNLLWVIATKSHNHCTERFELDLFYKVTYTGIFATNFAVWQSLSDFTSTIQRGKKSFSHVKKLFNPITNHGLSELCFRGLFRSHHR